ncbi:MAG: hypothetical protein WKG01_19450 [Kofleriaceae bacterium]
MVDDRTIRVLDGATVIADHTPSWARRQVIEVAEHRAVLLAERRLAISGPRPAPNWIRGAVATRCVRLFGSVDDARLAAGVAPARRSTVLLPEHRVLVEVCR